MRLKVEEIAGLKVLDRARHGDDRGFLMELYREDRIAAELGPDLRFVQDNLSFSRGAGTVRGLHYQRHPEAQGKLVAVLRGRILDVAVDLRRDSPTYGRHAAVILAEDGARQFYIPEGFAHGFCTLEPDTLVLYKLTRLYAPAEDGGLLWSDPALGIDWPVAPEATILSGKDRVQPRLADLPPLFSLAGPP